jgi:hypothetical protein
VIHLISKAKRKQERQFDAANGRAAIMSRAVSASLTKGLITFKNKVEVERLSEFLAKQDLEGTVESIPWQILPDRLNLLGPSVLAGITDGGDIAHQFLPQHMQPDIRFDSRNPRIDKILQRRVGTLIGDITEESRAEVRSVVRQVIDTGMPLSAASNRIRDVVGLTEQQSIAIMNFRNALESGAYSALTQNQRSVVAPRMFFEEGKKINLQDRAVRARFNRIVGQKDMDRLVDAYAERLLRHRSENIARTESFQAINEGQREFWSQADEQGILGDNVRKEWIIDPVTACELCRPVNGQRVRLNEMYQTPIGPVIGPTLHPSCNCMEALVFVNSRNQEEAA